jgi:hypothetical protein
MRRLLFAVAALVFIPLLYLHAQERGQAPATGRSAAPFDPTGYWVSLVTDDWRYRMLTPPKGNVDYIPISQEGRQVTEMWDPAKDQASGEQCKAYGAGGVMRLPGRLHITWEADNTLRIDTDAGTQTRRFFFGGTQPTPSGAPSWQGHSVARWDIPAPARRGSPVASTGNGAQLRATTTHLRPGYLRKNGVPYSANAVINEYFVRLVDKTGQEYLAVTTMVDDPQYLAQPYVKTYQYKKQRDSAGWNPTPCVAK